MDGDGRPWLEWKFGKFWIPEAFMCPDLLFLTLVTSGHIIVDELFHVGPVEVSSDHRHSLLKSKVSSSRGIMKLLENLELI